MVEHLNQSGIDIKSSRGDLDTRQVINNHADLYVEINPDKKARDRARKQQRKE